MNPPPDTRIDASIKVLLVEDNPADALLVEHAFEEIASLRAVVHHVSRLEAAKAQLAAETYDVVLLDLGLPDAQGIDTFCSLHATHPNVPTVVFTGMADAQLGLAAIQAGAADYLVKGQTDSPLLERSARFAIERARNQQSHLELARAQAAREEAESANRAKDEFLALLSHELRTPLNAIVGWSSLLRAGSLNPDTMRMAIESIELNAQAQARMIEDLLDISRVIAGQLSLNSGPLLLSDVVKAAVESQRPTLLAKQLEVQLDLHPVDIICADCIRLQQAVGHLLSNAIKFTPEGGTISVLLEQKEQKLQLTISDTGEGIEPEHLPLIFNRFWQADSSTTRRHDGLGIGLSVTQHLIELHGGHIKASSQGKGHGATFQIILPLRSDIDA
jgi:signal transduction histidine kinase